MEFAESEFALSEPQSDGQPLREHLESVWRQTGKQPAQLAGAAQVPLLAEHLWGWFLQLHAARGSNGMEPGRITATQVMDWMWFNSIRSIELWEKQAIHALDNCWFRHRSKQT